MKKLKRFPKDEPMCSWNQFKDKCNELVDAVNYFLEKIDSIDWENGKVYMKTPEHPPKEPECSFDHDQNAFEDCNCVEKPTKNNEPHIHKYPRHTVDKCYCTDGDKNG